MADNEYGGAPDPVQETEQMEGGGGGETIIICLIIHAISDQTFRCRRGRLG